MTMAWIGRILETIAGPSLPLRKRVDRVLGSWRKFSKEGASEREGIFFAIFYFF